jgi:hypothetical protein
MSPEHFKHIVRLKILEYIITFFFAPP